MMIGSADPHSLTKLLAVFAHGDRIERVDLSSLRGSARKFYSDALESSARLMAAGGETYRANATVYVLTRLIWSLVPPRLLTATTPDFRTLAEKSLTARFGKFASFDDCVRFLATIFKRIRKYALSGRQAQSLNLELVGHQELMSLQGGRCAHCHYEFRANDYFYTAEEEGIVIEHEPMHDGELRLSSTPRRPELDHIIPLILGGDGLENCQILCRSCNAGKSDQFSYLSTVSGQSYNRVGHLFDLTAGKRYAVIAEATLTCNPVPNDGRCFRIFKVDKEGLANPENLRAEYR